MDKVVELVVVIPTSPRSSKTESRCKKVITVFVLLFSSRPDILVSEPEYLGTQRNG
jgi:hypothetical protein